MFTKMRRFWKVRAIPSRAAAAASTFVISLSPNQIWPPAMVCSLLIALNRVVLPAPLGPIKAVILPSSTSKETSLTAFRPPKCTDAFSMRRSGPSDLVSALLWAKSSRRSPVTSGAAVLVPTADSAMAPRGSTPAIDSGVGRAACGSQRATSLSASAASAQVTTVEMGTSCRVSPLIFAHSRFAILGRRPRMPAGRNRKKQDHNDRIDGPVVLQHGPGEPVDDPGHDDRPDDPAPDPPVTAHQHHDDGKHRSGERELLRRDCAVYEDEQPTGQSAEHGVEDKRAELPVRVAYAQRRRGDLAHREGREALYPPGT